MFYLLTSLLAVWLSVISYLVFRLYQRSQKTLPPQIISDMNFSLVRFNPFSDTGGEQSFVVSLLDGGGNGILLTSLHGRGVTRIYAKKVTAGKTDQELSTEERTALQQALSSEKNNHE